MAMFFLILAALSAVLLVAPLRSGIFARGIAAYSVASNWIYGSSLLKENAASSLGALGNFVNYSPSPLGAEAMAAIAMFAVCITTAIFRPARLHYQLNVTIPSPFRIALLLVSMFSATYVASAIGFHVLVSYEGYGSIKNADVVFGENPFGRLAGASLRVSTLALILVSVISLKNGRKLFFSISLFPILLSTVVSIAEAGRTTAIYFAAAAAAFALTGKRTASYCCFALVLVSLIYALDARGERELGLAHVADSVSRSISAESIENAILNVTSGLFVTSASARVALPENYGDDYKLISFLPSIDFLDGFQAVKRDHEQRILAYLPFSSFAESYLFGWGYLLYFISVICLAAIAVQSSSRWGLLPYMLCGLLFSFALVLSSQYPVRNSMRFYYLVLLLYFFLGRLNRLRMRQQYNEQLAARPVGVW